MIEIQEKEGGVTLRVRVVPRASKTAFVGEIDGAAKIRIASPPVDGAANDELIRFLSKFLDVPRSVVEIIGGHTSKSKIIRVAGITADAVRTKLF